jgi:hypothetical protein
MERVLLSHARMTWLATTRVANDLTALWRQAFPRCFFDDSHEWLEGNMEDRGGEGFAQVYPKGAGRRSLRDASAKACSNKALFIPNMRHEPEKGEACMPMYFSCLCIGVKPVKRAQWHGDMTDSVPACRKLTHSGIP